LQDIKQFTYSFWSCFPALPYPGQLELAGPVEPCTSDLFQLACSSPHTKQPFLLVDGKVTGLGALAKEKVLDSCKVVLVFHNPSSVAHQPGWVLRNILAAVVHSRPDWQSLKVLALRRGAREESFLLSIKWVLPVGNTPSAPPKAIGWERDARDQLTYRQVDLKPMFDPLAIMEQSVDLNLKLIRWRQAPDIRLERFTSLRVLMLGSGTLGCNIARCLLGWGVRHFTFVDHAQLAYNNPIRQSLFNFDDCKEQREGKKNKAMMAAASLKRIYPLVDAEGLDMKVPMPGHPYSDKGEWIVWLFQISKV